MKKQIIQELNVLQRKHNLSNKQVMKILKIKRKSLFKSEKLKLNILQYQLAELKKHLSMKEELSKTKKNYDSKINYEKLKLDILKSYLKF